MKHLPTVTHGYIEKSQCPRCCQGLLVYEQSFDMLTAERIEMVRCIQCGHLADPVLDANRALTVRPPPFKRVPRHR